MDWNVWGPPLAVLIVGVVAGGGLALAGRGGTFRHDPKPDDLAVRKQVLLTQLRDLDGEQTKLDPSTHAAQREALLSEAAEVLRALEEGHPTPPAESAGGSRHLLGFGVGVLAFLLLAGLALSKALAPRGDGSLTGNAQSAGPVAEAEAAFAANPEDLDSCNTLTKVAIYSGDLMTAMERHDQCSALDRQDPVVAAHGAAMYVVIGRFEEAKALLDPHLEADPVVWEVQLWRGLADLNLGEVDAGLERLQRVADHAKDPLDADFARFVISDVKSSRAGPAPTETVEAAPAKVHGTVTGEIEPGGTLFVYVKNAAVDGGPPLGARKYADWSLPLEFSMDLSHLLPFAGGQWPEPAYVKVKLVRSGDPMKPSDGDIESEWIGPVSADEPLDVALGQ